jgi:hypothetical protein
VDIAQPNGEKSSNKKWVFSVHKNYSKLAPAAAITGSEIHLQTSLQHQVLKETQKRENFLLLKLRWIQEILLPTLQQIIEWP